MSACLEFFRWRYTLRSKPHSDLPHSRFLLLDQWPVSWICPVSQIKSSCDLVPLKFPFLFSPSSGLSNTLVLFSWVSKSKESTCTLAPSWNFEKIIKSSQNPTNSNSNCDHWLVDNCDSLVGLFRAWDFDPSFPKPLLPVRGALPLHSCRPDRRWMSRRQISEDSSI